MQSGVRENVHKLVAEDGVVPGATEANEDLPQSGSRRRCFLSMLSVKRCGAVGGQRGIEDLPAAEDCEGVGKDLVQFGDVLVSPCLVRIDLQDILDKIPVLERCRRVRLDIPDAAERDRAATDCGIVGDSGFDEAQHRARVERG